MVGKDNPGVDVERSAASGFPNRVAQCVDPPHQQIRMTVEQVRRKEECSARNPMAAIVWHEESMHGLGERRNALPRGSSPRAEGCSALRLLARRAAMPISPQRRTLGDPAISPD